MSGLDKILEHISNEAAQQAEKILANGKAEADRILASEKEEAKRLESQIAKQNEMDVSAASKRIQSAADLKEKRMILEAKQKEIDSVIEAASEKLVNLPDGEYFAYLEKMLDKYSKGQTGTICLNKKDLARLPAGFEEKAKAKNLSLSKTAADITGGFVLVYGDVEENCSFEALINASREQLQDKIGQILFS